MDLRMSRRGPGRRRRLIALVLASVIVGVGVWTGIVASEVGLSGLPDLATDALWKLLGVRTADGDAGGEPTNAAGTTDTSLGAGQSGEGSTGGLISEETRFVWAVTYSGCGCVETEETGAGPDVAGLGEADLTTILAGTWTIASYSPERVELAQTAPGMCPKHTKRTLRLEDDGSLEVYAGAADDPGTKLIPVGPATDVVIDVSGLDPALVEDLRAGLSFDSQEAVYRYLEGLAD